jgi:hypothetical protein
MSKSARPSLETALSSARAFSRIYMSFHIQIKKQDDNRYNSLSGFVAEFFADFDKLLSPAIVLFTGD